MNTIPISDHAFGMIGLGVMGRNLLLNMADHGFAVAGYNKTPAKLDLLAAEAARIPGAVVPGFGDLDAFVGSLKRPRIVMLLVTAGPAVDEVIAELLPRLDKNDIIIDGGNSHFTDTTRRAIDLEAQGYHFFGMGVSGGEEGAWPLHDARWRQRGLPGGETHSGYHSRSGKRRTLRELHGTGVGGTFCQDGP